MIRKAVAVAAALFFACMVMLTGLVLTPTTSPGSVGSTALMALAAANAKEGQGDLLCGPTGKAGAGATVAAMAAKRAGWTGDDLVLAVAIAGAESTWNPSATNLNANGSTDYGLWQVNSVHATILASGDWRDPYSNARMAHQVWAQAGGWTPWVTFNEGLHAQHIPAARAALSGSDVVATQPCTSGDAPSGPDRLTPWTRAMRDDVARQFPDLTVGCYRSAEDGGEHPRGRACDFMVEGARGDQVATYVQQSAPRLHVLYIIWAQHIWSPERADEGWRPMEDRGSPTQNHYDHVHVSVRP